MKIKAHVLAVEDAGEIIKVRTQGEPIGSAAWRGLMVYEFPVPLSERNKRAFYIGREIRIEITTR